MCNQFLLCDFMVCMYVHGACFFHTHMTICTFMYIYARIYTCTYMYTFIHLYIHIAGSCPQFHPDVCMCVLYMYVCVHTCRDAACDAVFACKSVTLSVTSRPHDWKGAMTVAITEVCKLVSVRVYIMTDDNIFSQSVSLSHTHCRAFAFSLSLARALSLARFLASFSVSLTLRHMQSRAEFLDLGIYTYI